MAAMLLLLLLLAAASEGMAAGGAEGDLLLDEGLSRAGHRLYHATVTLLLDTLLPRHAAEPQSRSGGGYAMDVACMGAVYRRSGGGSVCVDALTAAAVVGGALLLQFLFYAAVTAACPVGASFLAGSATRNITYVINVDNSNAIDVQMMAGDQDLMQTQDQEQGLTQTQTQTQDGTQNAGQSVNAPQMQEQTQMQTQRQNDNVQGGGIRRRQEDLDDCVNPEECLYPEDYDYRDDPGYPVATGEPTGETVGERRMTGETDEGAGPSAGGQARRRRRWTLPALGVANLDLSNLALSRLGLSNLGFSLCPALGLYLGR